MLSFRPKGKPIGVGKIDRHRNMVKHGILVVGFV